MKTVKAYRFITAEDRRRRERYRKMLNDRHGYPHFPKPEKEIDPYPELDDLCKGLVIYIEVDA